ncbi:hypothetical protein MAHJHV65_12900 [Mycobacterium avium subsp. hominissuis]
MKVIALMAAGATAAIGLAAPAAASPISYMEHDGTYRVGRDIQPGLYFTQGSAAGRVCSWSRGSDRVQSSEAQYVLIAPTDMEFRTEGCQPWTAGTRPASPIAPPGRTCIYPLTGCVDVNPW